MVWGLSSLCPHQIASPGVHSTRSSTFSAERLWPGSPQSSVYRYAGQVGAIEFISKTHMV